MFGGAVGLPMQLRQGAQGMLNAVVPAGVWGAPGDQGPQEVVEAVEGEDMAGRSQSSIIKRREAAMLVKFLEQANEEREYEVSIPDNESVYSAFAYSRAPTAPGSSTRGDVGYSAASDIWDDINQAEDSCLDQGVIQLGANMDDGVGCISELQFNLTGQTGSYIYMAPEMFKGLPYNEKVDMFSLGCIIYELFARVLLLFQETPANHGDDCQRYASKVARGYRPKKPDAFPDAVWSL